MKLVKFFTKPGSVPSEILQKLPEKIDFEFRAEFDDQNNPIIFITAPDHEGLITEAMNFDEAVRHAGDAALTYFDVPREHTHAISYEVQEAKRHKPLGSSSDASELSLRHIVLSRHTLAHA